MKKIFIIALIVLVPCISAGQESGGLSFLKIGVGGRATGLGEAFTTLARGPVAAYWNPAGLFSHSKYGIIVSHTEWFEDVTLDYAAFKWQNSSSALALSIYNSNVNDIEYRTGATPDPDGMINAHDLAAGLSYCRSISDRLIAGITAKYIHQKIFIESAAGFGLDLGMQYTTSVNGLVVGGTVRNIGSMNALKEEETKLPLLVRGGAHFRPAVLNHPFYSITFAADYEYAETGNNHFLLGTEFSYKDNYALRAGYQGGYDSRNITGGFGMTFSQFTFNYGYTPFSDDLGTSHRISAEFNWQ